MNLLPLCTVCGERNTRFMPSPSKGEINRAGAHPAACVRAVRAGERRAVDAARATAIHREGERTIGEQPGAEVVLLSSKSEEALRRTHSSYFGAGKALTEALDGTV